jgi:hypothetical protein
MPADLQYLRRHYASLSDDALLAVDRSDLVETAQKCYDEELKRRDLTPGRRARRPDREPNESDVADLVNEDAHYDAAGDSDQPDWLEPSAEVFSLVDRPGDPPGVQIADARDALEAARIPCYLDLIKKPEDRSVAPPINLWRLLVPGNLNLLATSVLDRDIFNQDFEQTWKTHLETLSDAELRQMSPEIVFCGLFDRVERVKRAYDDELARRKLRREK